MTKIVLAALLAVAGGTFVAPAFAEDKPPMTEMDCKKMTDKMKMEECMKMIKK